MYVCPQVIIAGAFYPQYFLQVSEDEGRERDAVRTLGGLDPRNTVSKSCELVKYCGLGKVTLTTTHKVQFLMQL